MKSRIMLCAALAGLALLGLLVTRVLQKNESDSAHARRAADTEPSTASFLGSFPTRSAVETPTSPSASIGASSTPPGLEAFRNLSHEAESLDALLESLPH